MDPWIPEVNMTLTEYRSYLSNKFFGFSVQTLLIVYIAIATLGLLGVLGNIISMVTWSRLKDHTSSPVLLIALAASDLLILICGNTPELIIASTIIYLGTPSLNYTITFISPYITKWFLPVYWTAQAVSIYITLIISVERFIAVCRPFKARSICTSSAACKCVVAVIAVSILYNLIGFLKETVVAHISPNGEVESYSMEDSNLGQSPLFKNIYEVYRSWLHLILIFSFPLVFIIAINSRTYTEHKKLMRVRRTLTPSQMRESKLTVMLLCVIVEFVVCSSVNVICKIIAMLQLSPDQLGFNPGSLTPVNTFLETFNASSNVVTYILVGRSFRKELAKILSCCKRDSQPRSSDDNRKRDIKTRQIRTKANGGNPAAELQSTRAKLTENLESC